MKKIVIITVIALSVGTLSCKKENVQPDMMSTINPVTFGPKRDLGSAD